ncbi:hypothetical protein F0562_030373 [Nyssa sinensis]|uniref:PB1 domain-containing protein n=1 Tax=Nyssa sinensis TaxID=561372 RepID=A0A5J5AYM7_9ASTE|nr:hypothetical protein F0562_030373 [Nyssa sinensis]
MAEDTAVDFFMENLMELMNCDNEFILHEKDSLKSLYEELEFLRKFLKDTEEKRKENIKVKDLVAKIRDVTFEAEKSVDLFVLDVSESTSDMRLMCSSGGKILSNSDDNQLHYVGGDTRIVDVYRLICISTLLRGLSSIFDTSNFVIKYKLPNEDFDALITVTTDEDIDDSEESNSLHFPLDLTGVLEEIGSIKTEIVEIYGNKLYGVGVPQVKTFSHGSCSRTSAPNVEEETLVGFDDEVDTIKDRLIGVHNSNQLEVISIVGMAGLGKTTLAKKVYDDPLVVYHFYIRGWTSVSQVFQKRDLLLGILTSFVQQENEIYRMSNEKLGERLYKCLKGRRYLVVMDDIWDIEAWNDTKMYFPNDNNGSRILFTSRMTDVALQAKPDSPPHFLHFLTDDESWNLLQKKVFQKKSCPTELVEIGKQIAKKCQGLPLAIVVVAGLLAKTEQAENWWKKVAESVSSYILNEPKQYMDTLALSYNHLPPHLKSCFLFMGAFPEDYEIPVQKLIWLWIAEGFIRQTGQKSKEDVAEEYLVDLIDRSLVLVAKRVLDLSPIEIPHIPTAIESLVHLRYLALQNDDDFVLSHSISKLSNLETLILIREGWKHVRDSFGDSGLQDSFEDSGLPDSFVDSGLADSFWACDYLADGWLPDSFGDFGLRRLEEKTLHVPPSIWKLVKLRHIQIPRGSYADKLTDDVYPLVLDNLQTISQVRPTKSFENVLARTPNLKKLGFCGNLISESTRCFYLTFPDLSSLNYLETLKLSSLMDPQYFLCESLNHCKPCVFQWDKFPPNLKKLTLQDTCLAWEEMSILGKIPNLEVLKLMHNACIGLQWETSGGGFHRLKFLKLDDLHIARWKADSIHFPSLQHLVLSTCQQLEKIPSSLGDIPTLQIIELSWCSHSAVNSAKKIQEEQRAMGNDLLNVLIKRCL